MVGAVVMLIVITAGMVSTTYVQFLKGGLLVVFSAVLTLLILNRGFTTDPQNTGFRAPKVTHQVDPTNVTIQSLGLADSEILPAEGPGRTSLTSAPKRRRPAW